MKYIYQNSVSDTSEFEYRPKHSNEHHISIYENEQLRLFDNHLNCPDQLAFKASLKHSVGEEGQRTNRDDLPTRSISFHPLFDPFVNKSATIPLSWLCLQSIAMNIQCFDEYSLRSVLQASTDDSLKVLSLSCCYFDTLRNDTIKYLALYESQDIHIGPSITMSGLDNLFAASRCAHNWRPSTIPETWESFDVSNLDLRTYSSLSAVRTLSLVGCALPLFVSLNRIHSELPGLTSLLIHQVKFYHDFKLSNYGSDEEWSIVSLLLDMIMIRSTGIFPLLEILEISSCSWLELATLDSWISNYILRTNNSTRIVDFESSTPTLQSESSRFNGKAVSMKNVKLKSIKLRGLFRKDSTAVTASANQSSHVNTQRKEMKSIVQKFRSIGVELQFV